MAKMSEPAKNPFEPFFDEIRKIVREEVAAALNKKQPTRLQFTKEEAAQRLNVKPSWLGARVRAKELPLPHHRHGHRIYFTQQDIDEIMQQSAISPKSNGKG
jgi:D-aminopeptidase